MNETNATDVAEDSFRPFGTLPLTVDNDLRLTVFSACIIFIGLSVAGIGYMAYKAYRDHVFGSPRGKWLQIACIIGIFGVAASLTGTASDVWYLPGNQQVWSITLAVLGFELFILAAMPVTMCHTEDSPVVDGRSRWLFILSAILFISGIGVVSAYWFHRSPIWGVAITIFVLEIFTAVVILGVTVWRNVQMMHGSKGVIPGVRLGIFLLATGGYITFYAMESPIHLMMRFLEFLSLVAIGGVIFWTSLALDGVKVKSELPSTRLLVGGELSY